MTDPAVIERLDRIERMLGELLGTAQGVASNAEVAQIMSSDDPLTAIRARNRAHSPRRRKTSSN